MWNIIRSVFFSRWNFLGLLPSSHRNKNDPAAVENENRGRKDKFSRQKKWILFFRCPYKPCIDFHLNLCLSVHLTTKRQNSHFKHFFILSLSRRMEQSEDDPEWCWVFCSRRKDLSTLPEEFWWVLDITRCSIGIQPGQNSCQNRVCAAGRTLSEAPALCALCGTYLWDHTWIVQTLK